MATVQNHEIMQGDTYRWRIRFLDINGVPIDLRTCTLRGQIRKNFTATTHYDWTFEDFDQSVTENLGYTYAELSASLTAGIDKGTYKYDIEIELDTNETENDGEVHKAYRGEILILPEVTRGS